MNSNEKAALGLHPNAAHEKPEPTAKLDRNRSLRKFTRRHPVAADDDLARVLAQDLCAVFARDAREIDLVKLGAAIAAEALRREARP